MERRCKSQQNQIFELKQELTNSTAELKLRLAQAEGNTHSEHSHTHIWTYSLFHRDFLCHTLTDRLETEKRRSKQALEDLDALRQKEVIYLFISHLRAQFISAAFGTFHLLYRTH